MCTVVTICDYSLGPQQAAFDKYCEVPVLLTGMRMRNPKSLLAGLMWFDPHRPDALNNIRHNAQERDGQYCTDSCVHTLTVKQAVTVPLSVCGKGRFPEYNWPMPQSLKLLHHLHRRRYTFFPCQPCNFQTGVYIFHWSPLPNSYLKVCIMLQRLTSEPHTLSCLTAL